MESYFWFGHSINVKTIDTPIVRKFGSENSSAKSDEKIAWWRNFLLTKFFSPWFFSPDDYSLPTNIFKWVQIFWTFFRWKLNVWLLKFAFKYHLRQKKAWRKLREMQWLLDLFGFYCFSSLNFSKKLKLLNFLSVKIRRQKKLLGKKWRNFWLVTKFFTDESF